MTYAPAIPVPPPAPVRRANPLGVTGLVIALLAWLTPVVLFAIGFAIGANDPTGLVGAEGFRWLTAFGFAAFGIALAGLPALVGLGLGIGSLFVKDRSRVAGILAICFGGIPVLVSVGAVASFLLASAAPQ